MIVGFFLCSSLVFATKEVTRLPPFFLFTWRFCTDTLELEKKDTSITSIPVIAVAIYESNSEY